MKQSVILIATAVLILLVFIAQSWRCYNSGYDAGYDAGKKQAEAIKKEVIRYVYITDTTKAVETEAEPINLGMFTVTAYCSCEKCCGKWSYNRPLDENGKPIVYTASGEIATEGITIAADTNVYPFGTELYINGHKYIVQDRGSAIKGKKIDIYFDTHEKAVNWGKQKIEVFK